MEENRVEEVYVKLLDVCVDDVIVYSIKLEFTLEIESWLEIWFDDNRVVVILSSLNPLPTSHEGW